MTDLRGVVDRPLRTQVVRDALLIPATSRTLYSGFNAAVFDGVGELVERAQVRRTWRREVAAPPDPSDLDLSDVDREDEPHVFAGYLFDHFGHFLLESLSRCWVIQEVGDLPMVWVSSGPMAPWQTEILSVLGIRSPHRFAKKPTRFRTLIVPDAGFYIDGVWHPDHARFLARHRATGPGARGQRVWLSRSGAPAGRRSGGEAAVQRTLAARGWRIVEPSGLGVRDQLDLFLTADVVAGLEGSAFHAAVLLAERPAPVVISRRTTNRSYDVIAAVRHIPQFDLYGAYQVHDRRLVSLKSPGRWARIVDAVADGIVARRRDPEALEAFRLTAMARYSFVRWERRQRWRLVPHAILYLRHHPTPRRVRRRIAIWRDALRRRMPTSARSRAPSDGRGR